MILIKDYLNIMQEGNAQKLAELFDENAFFFDNSMLRVGKQAIKIQGKLGIEMLFHNKFGMNKGPFKIKGIEIIDDNCANFNITYGNQVVMVHAFIVKRNNDKIQRLNVLAF